MIEVFFQFEFLRYSLFTGLMIGILAPAIGVFLVVRRLSLMADALSHITLTGIAFSLLLGRTVPFFAALNPVYMGMLFSVVGSLAVDRLGHVYRYYKELAIPIILSSGIGIGVVFISLADGFNNDLFNYLFGSVIAVSQADFYLVLALLFAVSLFIILFYKELLFLSFDEEQAIVSGLPRSFLHLSFMIVTAVVIGVSMQIVGILLVSALMTLPVAAAMRLADSFKQMLMYSIVIGEISVLAGMFSAFHLDLAPGGTIVMTNLLILTIIIMFTKSD
ncbi:metal ABC transporter permease [Salisediminibacterium halotolerans]|uniref:metal ABC transporter permease n=1 Tax=Salisediminibacterium halotolerans TaxID=517425 RepID=UPI000EB28C3A|nr:metal ABC transporter permease [Salisediminibacterium halotolerans]RLJ78128.1 zinc transport system permease protein [Actinophytocola xinjiangensis]RPE88533.1 zinc transport system permease protein [Salisediminibacterium halotolerans]TWG37105.1 zinc transport system permease protein [Salisediminibacterium halotolerans]GEL08801.1 zinc ABC transporter permease [Salisediminibacterium halotolerans]